MVLTLPKIIDDYYEEIEQNLSQTTNRRLLADCDYIIGELAIGEWYSYDKKDISSLKRFATLLRQHITSAIVIRQY